MTTSYKTFRLFQATGRYWSAGKVQGVRDGLDRRVRRHLRRHVGQNQVLQAPESDTDVEQRPADDVTNHRHSDYFGFDVIDDVTSDEKLRASCRRRCHHRSRISHHLVDVVQQLAGKEPGPGKRGCVSGSRLCPLSLLGHDSPLLGTVRCFLLCTAQKCGQGVAERVDGLINQFRALRAN